MAKFNVKTINKKTMKVEGKLIPTSSPKVPKPPAWFALYEIRINQRFDKIESRLDNLVTKNNLVE